MRNLLIALLTIGLLGSASLALADPDRNESGFVKAHERHDGYLTKRVYRDHPGHRGRGHDKHHHKKGPKWHHRDRHHRHSYRDHKRHYRDDYPRHRRSYHDHDRRGSFFGIADGDRGVLIWKN